MNPQFSRPKNKKSSSFQISLIVLTFLTSTVLSSSSVFAMNDPYKRIPTKVTSSIDCAPSVNLAAIQPTKSGNWNDASVWPGNNLPTANDDVTIPAGRTVTLMGTCHARSIWVDGVLNASNQSINLETGNIIVAGRMEIGTESQPYTANGKCLITLTGNKSEGTASSNKGILVQNGGTLELHGKKRMSWTNLAVTANAGSNQITLKEAVDWEVGDVIALTSTALASTTGNTWEQVDQVTIQAISTDKKTLTLATNLQYKHIGGSKTYTRPTDGKTWTVDIQGEVGLLSHYIKIQGKMDENNEADGFGGHIMLMKGSTSHSENIELYKMGQEGVRGRYPYHWHLNEDKSKGSYLKNSSVHKSFHRAVTIHGTDYVTVDGVFAYDHIGHGIFLENGGERGNTIKNNVVFVTRRPTRFLGKDEFTISDHQFNTAQNRTPSSYWITNPNNYFENNIAAGTEGTGFWIALPTDGTKSGIGKGQVMGPDVELDYFKNINPVEENLGKFDGFVAHTCMNGWDIFDQLNPDHEIVTNGGWRINTNQYIENGIMYGNDTALYCGLGNGGDAKKVVFRNCVFSDNRIVSMLAADLTIENALFNVDSELGVFDGVREFYRFYDGPGRHLNCHFEGWERSNATIFRTGGGGATTNFNVTFIGTTIGSADYIPFKHSILGNVEDVKATRIGLLFKDYDGGLLGKSHTTLITDIPFLRDGHEYRHPSWENAARSDYYFGSLWIHGISSTTKISVTRSKPGTEDVCFYQRGATTSKFPLIVNEDFLYSYRLDRLPDGKLIRLFWKRGDPGDLTLVRFEGLGKLSAFSVRGIQGTSLIQANSLAAVESSNEGAYYIAESGDVYIKLKNNPADKIRTSITIEWSGNGSYTTPELACTTNNFFADNDGDGIPDVIETDNCYDPNNASDLNFGFKGNSEYFERFNTAAESIGGEAWLIRADNSDNPYVVRRGLGFSGNQVPQIRIKTKSQATGSFQLFWTTTDQPDFAAARSVTVAPQQTNVFEELVFDMSGFNTWMGETITQIRLDFPPDITTNRHTWIDYIHGPDANPDVNCGGSLSTDQFSKTNKLKLYPNPTQNTLFISGNTGDKLIKIYDLLGSVQITKTLKDGETEIDLSGLSAGLYLVRMTNLTRKSELEEIHRILKAN